MTSRVLVVFLVLAGAATAQFDVGSTVHRVRVRLAVIGGECDAATRVALFDQAGPVAEAIANARCEADFVNVPVGTYHLKVSGQNFLQTDSESLDIGPACFAEFEVKVKRSSDLEWNFGAPSAALVSASDLGIPHRARKEVDKANELLRRQDLRLALQKLKNAIGIYPAYALAYNNLGVIYARLGDTVRERDALQEAISFNDHFALAYLNLGRMNVAAGDFPHAETMLQRAFGLDPTDVTALILLSYAELEDRSFDQAIATSRKAHALQKPHAVVHRVAARAFEQEGRGAEAIAELELFLEEEPSGPRADAAREELETVKAVLPSPTPASSVTAPAP